ncbi:hypothetical protein BDZ89DRAFT_1137379 [Hymenopellis radicata]|nr:hypothetical protein BDZ89DRAFT_1137379 [Hymenopellis radicata]
MTDDMKRKIDDLEVAENPTLKRDAGSSSEEQPFKRQRQGSHPSTSNTCSCSEGSSPTSSPLDQTTDDSYDLSSDEPLRLKDKDGYFFITLNRIISWISGRACIVNGKCDKWPDKELIVKIAWSVPGRDLEATFDTRIREAVSEKDAGWVLNHIPNVLHSQDFASASEAFMEAGAPIIEDYVVHTEDQDMALCVSVHEKLHKLSELKEVLDYAQAIFDVVQVHRWIYDHAKILHRDISEGNVMWHNRDGRVCGVLIDFELSTFRDCTSRVSRLRVGTPVYMAQDQHDPATRPPPLYRHELESFFYVLLILAGTNILLEQPTIDAITKEKCYLAPDPESPYRSWLPRSHEFLYHAKRELRKAGRPYAHPSFDVLTEFIHDLQKHLWRGTVAKSEHRERFLLPKDI